MSKNNDIEDDFPFPYFMKPSKVNRFDFKKFKEQAGLSSNGDVIQSKTKCNTVIDNLQSENLIRKTVLENNEKLQLQHQTFTVTDEKSMGFDAKKLIKNPILPDGTNEKKKYSSVIKNDEKNVFQTKFTKRKENDFKTRNSVTVNENEESVVMKTKLSVFEEDSRRFNFKTVNSEYKNDESNIIVKNNEDLSPPVYIKPSMKFDFKKFKEQAGLTNTTTIIDQKSVAIKPKSIKNDEKQLFEIKTKEISDNKSIDEAEASCSFLIDDQKFKSIDEDFNLTSNPQNDDLDINDIDWDCDVFNTTTTDAFPQRKDDSAEFQHNYPHTEVMNEVLHQKFGLTSYRPLQEEIINASLTQHDCFVLMPTGGGKSLCYQLPAILTPGVTIVISPLRALISDQVDKLNALDIPAAHLCSDVKKAATDLILAKLHTREPQIKLLYLTPEKIVASKNVCDLLSTLYRRGKLARFVIDEVHCLSQWGHDFRPDYKKLSELRQLYPAVPIMCLTATATRTVQNDVLNILKLKQVKTFIRGFNRPNIKYEVLSKTSRFMVKEISELIKRKFFKKSGIIYCLCRTDCEKLAAELCKCGIRARAYHAGMSDSAREKEQREWMQDQFHVIVATIAFGMGIDKPDVRYVIHVSIPKSVEAFYQESGRAGRDGEPSYSYLFYSYGDVGRLQRLIKLDKNVNKRSLEGHFDGLQKMAVYCENKIDCRRYLQLLHLGEKFDRKECMQDPITICDNCENYNNYKMLDVTNRARELAQIVEDLALRNNVTMIHIADVYKGSKIKKIVDLGHDKHPFYGRGGDLEKSDIHRILKELVFRRVLVDHCQFTGEFPIVYIKPGPKLRYETIEKIEIAIEKNKTATSKYAKIVTTPNNTSSNNNNNSKTYRVTSLKVKCHEELLEMCQKLAQERAVTLSSIMNLSAVKTMAETLPTTEAEFLKIQHVTKANYSKFGSDFLKITQKYKDLVMALERPIAVAEEPIDEDFRDWCERTGPSSSGRQGVKRKSSNGKSPKRGAKRFKKSYAKRKWKSGARKGKKRTPVKKGKKSKIDLMPVVHVS